MEFQTSHFGKCTCWGHTTGAWTPSLYTACWATNLTTMKWNEWVHVSISFPFYAFAVPSLDNYNHITYTCSFTKWATISTSCISSFNGNYDPTFLSYLTSGPSLQRPGFMVCQQSLQVAMHIKEVPLYSRERSFPVISSMYRTTLVCFLRLSLQEVII